MSRIWWVGYAIAVIAILWACAGCQTMGGLCRDIESAARYGHEHMVVDE
jgi:predicted small secreted protein